MYILFFLQYCTVRTPEQGQSRFTVLVKKTIWNYSYFVHETGIRFYNTILYRGLNIYTAVLTLAKEFTNATIYTAVEDYITSLVIIGCGFCRGFCHIRVTIQQERPDVGMRGRGGHTSE